MKRLKNAFKKLIIIYLVVYITLSSMSSCFARGYDEKCGEYVSQWAKDYVTKYASQSSYTQSNLGNINGRATCMWSGGKEGSGTFYGCCTCFVHWIYYNSLGVDIYDYGFNSDSGTAYSALKGGNEYFDDVTSEELQAGDILIIDGHAEMYAGNGEHANFGGTPMNIHSACSKMTPGSGSAIAVRLKNSVDVNPAGTVAIGEVEEENLSIYDENGFIYSGVAKVEGYKGSASFGKWIISMLTEILDYLIGILTLGIRIVIVGWTAIIERFFIDGIVNSVTGVKNERVDDWQKDPNEQDDIDREADEENETEETNSQATGNPGDEDYVSEGVQGIADIGGKVQLKTTSEANVTIENIVYNKIPILDVNFFNFESAGGAVVDENGIIYIIKTNVAMWYYIFRIIAILIMLVVLIYLGIQIAINSVTTKKAIYKEQLLNWLGGFIIIFIISYAMYAIILLNEEFINWVIPKYEDGTEISLYETVRSKAYEIKASTGFTGMIMYIILVYYSIRFLLVYFKRYLVVTILALLSPFIGVGYSIEKVKASSKPSGILKNASTDFMYTVSLQSVHALIYTIFIQIILKLTEVSLIGIFISFIFLNFMVKVDPIWRKVFGYTGGKNTAKLSVDKLMPKIVLVRGIGKSIGKKTGAYVGFMGQKFGVPIANAAGKAGKKVTMMTRAIQEEIKSEGKGIDESTRKKQEKDRKKEREEKAKARRQMLDQVTTGLSLGKDIALMALKGALVPPMLIVESGIGIELLSSTISSKEKITNTIEKAKQKGMIPKTTPIGIKYKLKGVRSRNKKSANKLINRLTSLGIKFRQETNQVTIDQQSTTRRTTEQQTSQPTRKTNTNVEKNQRKLTPKGKAELLAKINMNNLKLASYKDLSYLLEKEDGIEEAVAYAQILEDARQTERELEQEYKQIIGKFDDKISEIENIEGIDPTFIKTLQEKKSKELLRMAQILSKPLSEKDIYKAIQNYKNKVPTFDSQSDRISQGDVEGIAKEINSILEAKGEEIQMSKEFIEKVQREITESRRKEQENKVVNIAGQDMTPKVEDETITEKKNTLNTDDRNSPFKNLNTTVGQDMSKKINESGPNAPKQNSTQSGSSVERLVKNIQNASKGSSSKTSKVIPRQAVHFTKKLEELEKISFEASNIIGEEIYDLDSVLERLKDL